MMSATTHGTEQPADHQSLRSAGFEARLGEWLAEPLGRHLLAIVLLMLVATLRWWHNTLAPIPQNDETIYFDAFEAVARGDSPYTPTGYLTFSFLAYAGGWAIEHLGRLPTLVLLRLANFSGMALAVWFSAAWIPWTWRRRLLATSAYVALAPVISFGIVLGNLSMAMAGMLIPALMLWPRVPATSGFLMGLSVAMKPVAPGAIVTLASHRPSPATRRHLITAGIAAVIIGLIVLVPPHLSEMLSKDVWPRLGRSVSPHRFAYLLGLQGSVPFISAGIALLAVFIARRRPISQTRCLALALTITLATTPLVWSHTLLVALPTQVLALLILHHRWTHRAQLEADGKPGSPGIRVEVTLILLAVAALQVAEGATNIYDQHLLIQWLGSITPVISPAALTAYIFRHTQDD